MSIIFERNILYVKNRDILFDYNIEKVIETNGVFIVLLDIPTKDNTVNNIYGIANDDIIWRIQSYLKIYTDLNPTRLCSTSLRKKLLRTRLYTLPMKTEI